MRESGNMYLLDEDEYMRANFLIQGTQNIEEKTIPGPCIVRVESSAMQEDIGNVISVQIGFTRGREYIVSESFLSVVFRNDD